MSPDKLRPGDLKLGDAFLPREAINLTADCIAADAIQEQQEERILKLLDMDSNVLALSLVRAFIKSVGLNNVVEASDDAIIVTISIAI